MDKKLSFLDIVTNRNNQRKYNQLNKRAHSKGSNEIEEIEEFHQKLKLLGNHKALSVMGIFFEDYHTLKEVSIIYNPENSTKKNFINERVVQYYFKKLQDYGWLEQKEIEQLYKRKTAKGKKSQVKFKIRKWRLNYEPYFFQNYPQYFALGRQNKKDSGYVEYLQIRRKLISFFDKSKIRSKISNISKGSAFTTFVYSLFINKLKSEVNERFFRIV